MAPETATAVAPTPDELTSSQRERRARILEAAQELASAGGFDAVQMRDVADKAEVALGTLYRYFPSKVHLLVACMRDQTEQLGDRLTSRPSSGETAAERVMGVLERGTRAMRRDPGLTEAMVRALMSADPASAAEAEGVTDAMTAAITAAMTGDDRAATEDDPAIARVLEQVWLTQILMWLSGRASLTEMRNDLRVAIRLLVR